MEIGLLFPQPEPHLCAMVYAPPTLLALIVALILLAICAGAFTEFFFFCLGDPHLGPDIKRGRILSWLALRLEKRWQRRNDSTERIAQKKAMGKKPDRHWDRPNWWKIGLCPICFNVYWSLSVFITALHTMDLSWAWLMATPFWLGISSMTLWFIQAKRRDN